MSRIIWGSFVAIVPRSNTYILLSSLGMEEEGASTSWVGGILFDFGFGFFSCPAVELVLIISRLVYDTPCTILGHTSRFIFGVWVLDWIHMIRCLIGPKERYHRLLGRADFPSGTGK